MRKLLKKSLACLLAAIFCVTLCVAAVPASAEAPTYATNDVVAKAGETVNIDFTVNNFANVKGAMIKFFLPEVVASITEVKINGEALAAYDAETGAGYYQVDGNSIKFLSLFGYEGELASASTLTFNVVAVIADDAAEGTYTYAAPYFSVTEDGETLVDVTGSFGKFEVKNAPAVLEPDASLSGTVYGTSAMIDSTFGIQFDLWVDLASYGADSFEFRVTNNVFNDDFSYAADPVTTVYTAEDTISPEMAVYSMYSFVKTFALYELQIPATYGIYLLKDGEVVAFYDYAPITLTNVAVARYNEPGADENVKKMVVALLNVGTKAQQLFASKPETATDSPLKTFAAPNADVDTVTYAVDYNTLEAVDSSFSGAVYETSLSLFAAPTLHYGLYDESFYGAADSFYVEASYFSKLANDTVKYTVPGTDLQDLDWGMFVFDFDKTCLYDTDKVVTLNVKKNDGTVVGTSVYSIDTLLLQNVNVGGLQGETFQAIASFAAHCRVFFPNF